MAYSSVRFPHEHCQHAKRNLTVFPDIKLTNNHSLRMMGKSGAMPARRREAM